MRTLGPNPAYFAHPTAIVDEGAEIGERTKIWHFSHVGERAVIGKGCTLGQNVFVAPNVTVGDNVKIQNNVSIYEGVTLEDNVFCGPSMVFTNVTTPRSGVLRNTSAHYSRTLVRCGATIGANATIVCGNTVGRFSFVGAGAVVTKDVPDYALVFGNPARIRGYACECGIRLKLKDHAATCDACGARYLRGEDNLRRDSS